MKKYDRYIRHFLFLVYAAVAIYTGFYDIGPRTIGLHIVSKFLICASIFIIFYVLYLDDKGDVDRNAYIYGWLFLILIFYYSLKLSFDTFNLLAILVSACLALMGSFKALSRVVNVIIILKVIQVLFSHGRFEINFSEIRTLAIIVVIEFTIILALKKSNSMVKSMTLRAQSNQELLKVVEIKRKEAKAAGKAKTDFLANMSHEIRTPMNAICGMTDLLLQTDMSEEQKDYVATIKNSSDNLLSIINDILDFSKIDAGKMELVEREYNLLSQLNGLQNTTDVRIGDRPLDFEISVRRDIPTRLFGDEVRVQQVILNLLTNAVKYSNEGHIRLILDYDRISDNMILLKAKVSDNGIGIKKEDLSKLFEAFSQVDMERNHMIEGTGIGLTITERLVRAMGGSITVDSEYGVGSTFSVTMKQRVVDFNSVIETNSLEDFIVISHSNILKGVLNDSVRIAKFHAPEARVLVVDDNEANLKVAQGLMKKYKLQVDTCSSGRETIEHLKVNQNYDVLFVDHMMPEMDGVELVGILRNSNGSFYKSIPIVALTANAIKGVSEMFLANGFNDYLSKPIDTGKLEKILKKWIPEEKQLAYDADNNADNKADDKADSDIIEKNTADNSVKEIISRIPSVDYDKAILLCGGDEGILLSVMNVYVKSFKRIKDRVEEFYATENLHDYSIEVHGVKSSSRSVGNNELGELAYALELNSKDGNLEFVKENNAKFIDMYTEFVKDMKAALAEINKEEAVDRVDISNEDFKQMLSECCEAYENYDTRKSEDIMTNMIKGNFSEDILEKLNEAKESAELFDFDIAGNILKELLQSL